MNITRKDFLKAAGVLSGGIFFSPLLMKLTGCSAGAESVTEKIKSNDGIVKYKINGTLNETGDSIVLEIDDTKSKIILIKSGKNNFMAMNSACTHKGCEVIKRKTFFECPCHNSEFDLKGNVLKGPAEEPLQTFKTEFDGINTITIFLK